MTTPILWYVADPMCSWCWGFAPVIDALLDAFRERARPALVLGGLRPGTREALTADARATILHHWHAVNARTGQPFRFDGALPEGFVYDTEPACRAVAVAGELAPDRVFDLFRAIQRAFYTEGRDVTRRETLSELAAGLGIERDAFARAFDSPPARARTEAHFRQARRAGVTGFPALILQTRDGLHSVSHGCLPLDTVRAALDRTL